MIRAQLYAGIWLYVILMQLPWVIWASPYDYYKNLQNDLCGLLDTATLTIGTDAQRIDMNKFADKWNNSLNSARKDLKDYKNGIWGFSVDEYDCWQGFNEKFDEFSFMDVKCFIRDLQTVGGFIHEDVERFDTDILECSGYPIFLQAWHQHPVIKRLRCYSDRYYREERPTYSIFQYLYDRGLEWNGPLSSWQSNPTQFATSRVKCGSVYSKSVSIRLRQEVERICQFSNAERICHLRLCMNIADSAEKLLEYTKSSAPTTEYYMYSFLYNIFVSVQKVKALYLGWINEVPQQGQSQQEFINTILNDDWVNSKVIDITNYILGSIDYVYDTSSDKGLQFYQTIDLLPVNYHHCPVNSSVLSLCWTIGVFNEMVQTLKQNTKALNKHNKIPVHTAVDYKAFLQHSQQERLLKLSETSQSNLMEIAKDLRDDIVHSLDKSISESIANSANEVKDAIQTGFGSLRKHFQQEASFDKAIAQADIGFIRGELDKYVDSSEQLTKRVSSLVGNILYHGFIAATGDNAENAIKLVAQFLSMFNPFKWLAGGTSAVDVMDATADYVQSLATLLKTDILKNAWNSLASKSYYLARRLGQNQAFLDNVRKLVNSLSAKDPPADFELQKERFIELYNLYSPAADREDITEVNGYWDLIIDEACDLIDSTSGSVSGGAKISLGSDCYDAKGEVQKLMVLFEEIFEFQFDMMDAMSDCVRASNSYQSASSITVGLDKVKEAISDNRESNVLDKLQLLAAYSSMQYRMTVLTAKEKYCNVLEYTEGHRPDVCETLDWNLANLLSRNPSRCQSTQDFKTVPTRSSSSGDKAFIDLKDLYAGKTVRFQVPDSQWLVKRGWISSDQRSKPIFVQRFEVYLPVNSASETKVLVTARASTGNHLYRDGQTNHTEYIINPRRPLTFKYIEGQTSCRNKEIPNPYSSSSCRQMPDLCQASTDLSDTEMQDSIYPSIYALWNIQLSGYESANLTTPVTNIDLRIGLQTCSPEVSRRKKRSSKKLRSRRETAAQKCCEEENHFVNETAMCEACPPNSVSKYNSLLCECLPCDNGGTVFQDGKHCSCLCDSEHEGKFCEIKKCIPGEEFRCNNTECIPAENYCDKNPDCSDDSDEPEGCERNSSEDCAKGGFCCSEYLTDCEYFGHKCVPQSFVCDGNYDCGSNLDELSCEGTVSEDCPEGWTYYSRTCFLFINESKTGTEAQDYCEQANGTLADLRKESEHWFTYSRFIYTVTGRTLSIDDNPRNGRLVNFANDEYGIGWLADGFWWIGQLDDDLGSFLHGAGNNTDGKCVALWKRDWKYSYVDCGARAEGLICTYRPGELTNTASSNTPTDVNAANNSRELEINNGLRDFNEGIQIMSKGLSEVFQDIGKEFKDIRRAMDTEFKDTNENLHLLLKKMENAADKGAQPIGSTVKPSGSDTNGHNHHNDGDQNRHPGFDDYSDQSRHSGSDNGQHNTPSWMNPNYGDQSGLSGSDNGQHNTPSWMNPNSDDQIGRSDFDNVDWTTPSWMNPNSDDQTGRSDSDNVDWTTPSSMNPNSDDQIGRSDFDNVDWNTPSWMNPNSDDQTGRSDFAHVDWTTPSWMNPNNDDHPTTPYGWNWRNPNFHWFSHWEHRK